MISENIEDFLNNSSVGIHTVSSTGIIEYANQFELNMLGYTQEEYIGHHAAEFQVDASCFNDMQSRLNKFEVLQNYPIKIKAKHEIIYVLHTHDTSKYEFQDF